MIHLPVVVEATVFVVIGGVAVWQERKEFRRIWRELRTGREES